jgi:hypothetical protein
MRKEIFDGNFSGKYLIGRVTVGDAARLRKA